MNKHDRETLFSSDSDEWETPNDFYESLDNLFHFTLDPCATLENAKCERYYTKEFNGLNPTWQDEVVFVNPPYSDIRAWVFKAKYEFFNHNAKVVMLIPARTDTKYFHDYILGLASIYFIRGRMKFENRTLPSWREDGGHKISSAPFPSMVVVYNPNWDDVLYGSMDRQGHIIS